MKISVLGSTKQGYTLPKEEALSLSGKAAGICYLPDTVETLFAEEPEKTERRYNGNLKSGHHSVFGHPTYNLIFEDFPKILAMIFNNEKIYNTSERSARYTNLEKNLSGKEKELYEKWVDIYKETILKDYPNFKEFNARKLAQENARYLVSIFTPYVVMEYTVSFEQLNYIISWLEDYYEKEPETSFSVKLKEVIWEFLRAFPYLKVDELNPRFKGTKMSLFKKRERDEEFGWNYCTNYKASFAEFAQAQRHRTLSYEISIPDEPQFYVPDIIKGTKLEEKWLEDISSLAENYPQGMLIDINERGTVENFVLKCTERLCGAAQLEIMQQTMATMQKYLDAVRPGKRHTINLTTEEVGNPAIYEYLLPYTKGARCTFPGWKCNSPCVFGGKEAMTREI